MPALLWFPFSGDHLMRVLLIALLCAVFPSASAQMLPSAELGAPPQLPAGIESESNAFAAQAAVAAVSVNPANRYGVSLLYRNTYAAEDAVTNGWNAVSYTHLTLPTILRV